MLFLSQAKGSSAETGNRTWSEELGGGGREEERRLARPMLGFPSPSFLSSRRTVISSYSGTSMSLSSLSPTSNRCVSSTVQMARAPV